jgi:hypothetical protein
MVKSESPGLPPPPAARDSEAAGQAEAVHLNISKSGFDYLMII